MHKFFFNNIEMIASGVGNSKSKDALNENAQNVRCKSSKPTMNRQKNKIM